MTSITLTEVTLTYPQVTRARRTLRAELTSYVAAVGGKLDEFADGTTVRAW